MARVDIIKAGLLAVFLSTMLVIGSIAAFGGDLDRFKSLQGTIDIAGGTAHIPVMKEAAKRIMQFNPQVRITIAGGGSGVGVQKVGEGLVSIGNTGRALTPAEVSKYGLKTFPFAIDGVAVAMHPKNPIHSLTADQVREIFSGAISNWKQVKGPDAPIHLFTRDVASGTREVFWKKLLKKGPIAKNANVVASNGAMKTAIARDPHAIGYLGIGHVDSTVQAVDLDGVTPTQQNAQAGKYPVVRKLYMNTKGEPTGVVKTFIEYIKSPEGAAIVQASGYIPLK